MFFGSFAAIRRSVATTVVAYLSLVALPRISGKRAVSKWNAFDLIVTVAIGSTLAGVILNEKVSVVQGAIVLALLILLQFLVTWGTMRAPWVERLF